MWSRQSLATPLLASCRSDDPAPRRRITTAMTAVFGRNVPWRSGSSLLIMQSLGMVAIAFILAYSSQRMEESGLQRVLVILSCCAITALVAISYGLQREDHSAVPLGTPVLLSASDGENEDTLVLSINGDTHRISNPSPSVLLSDYLRAAGLTGVKVACGEGGPTVCHARSTRACGCCARATA